MFEIIIVPVSYIDPLSVAVSFTLGAATTAVVSYVKSNQSKDKKD